MDMKPFSSADRFMPEGFKNSSQKFNKNLDWELNVEGSKTVELFYWAIFFQNHFWSISRVTASLSAFVKER
jgi:hypothetical protein